ncbi:MAG: 2Fe-2S iron-sulfur cluster binding domain-containing protein, partial [Coriobacteriales bacterium]|nr:2Fe-2S iron-sulfur cluster binding domain-containing protein [Coriobacteriales bacterium]
MKVLFPLIDVTVDVLPGTSVSVACERAGIPLDLVCGGNGTCGKCRVDVIERGERKNVLGCQYPVSEGMQVLRAQDASDHQLLETPLATGRSFAPGLRCVSISYGELVTPMGGYDYDTLAGGPAGAPRPPPPPPPP